MTKTVSREKNYHAHKGQKVLHYASDFVKRFVAMVTGIRGGKTYGGARQSLKMAWNAKNPGVFAIIAPTFKMLKKTTWKMFKEAAAPWILHENKSDYIITLKNGRQAYGYGAEDPDSIRNATFCGFWVDEAREVKDFNALWDVLLGRVLSTGGRGIVTTSPNGFDAIHEKFVEKRQKDYMLIRYSTYENIYIPRERIDELAGIYDEKLVQQEIYGEFVVFEGQVYYAFNRHYNSGDLAFELAVYDPNKPLCLCCDFNVDPMAWEIMQTHKRSDGTREVRFIDEIFIRNSNTVECCEEFKKRYPNHTSGLYLYGDATGNNRSVVSNVTSWKIIKDELARYAPISRVPTRNVNERDRVNSFNAMICNSKGDRRTLINPKTCKALMRDLEQVPFVKGSTKIDKHKDLLLTHASDAAGYAIVKEFSLNQAKIEGLRI